MSRQKTSKDSPNATSSQESPDGRGPCNSLVSHQMSLFGRAHAPANPFRAPGNKKAQTTKDTCGLSSTASSASADLQSSLANRLQASLDLNGSPEYALTWKRVDMPSGPPICRLRASQRRTRGNGYFGWPSPCTPNGGRSMSIEKMDATGKTIDGRKHSASLEHAVKFSVYGWPTPRSGETKGGEYKDPQKAMARFMDGATI